ncbi:MAG: GNAT family N-acetyltransferase [Ardenticatenaceae bacterium]|nr:GNAT family N-acetyltransferase [Ardenticatenaceae bacterium]
MNVSNNKEKRRYELPLLDEMAVLEYMPAGSNNVVFTHTEVPEALEGKGVGSQLVKYALEDIKERDMKLIPMCPFVAGYIKRHPEYRELVFGYRPG